MSGSGQETPTCASAVPFVLTDLRIATRESVYQEAYNVCSQISARSFELRPFRFEFLDDEEYRMLCLIFQSILKRGCKTGNSYAK